MTSLQDTAGAVDREQRQARADPYRRHGGHVPHGRDAVYLLVFTDTSGARAGYGPGWTLVADRGERSWSMSLRGRGAGPEAGRAQAEAAAVAVLAEHGIPVSGWHHDSTPTAASRAAVGMVPEQRAGA